MAQKIRSSHSTLGTHLRGYAFGHNRQLDAVASRFLTRLAGYCPILAGADQIAFVDVDDTIRETHGYKKQGVAFGDLLFSDESGRPVNDERLHRAHKKAAAAIVRPELRNHDLRATAATISAEAGATVREIQDQLGHTTPQMALRYQTASAARDAERARRVSEALDRTQ